MSWTDERVAILKKLWGEGKTAAEIAKELGGVTRNAVIGKAHRLKLSSRVSPIQQNTKKVAKKVEEKPVVRKIKAVKPKPEPVVSKPVGELYQLSELKERMCRWPEGDPRDDTFGFCGDKTVAGLPYCCEHAKVAYQAATRNRILKAEEFDNIDNKADEDAKDSKSVEAA